MNRNTNVENLGVSPAIAKQVLAAGDFSRLGLRQKHIVKQLVENDYYILKTLDTRDMSITISLQDEWGNQDRDLSESELQALWKRGILLNADVSMCLELIQEKFWLNEQFAEDALNACC
ncbi:MAG TPA: hypothetical protein PKM40_03040 [Bacteroidia bacterium]|nr:hypothetical protein [Bacteroidia bacterium]